MTPTLNVSGVLECRGCVSLFNETVETACVVTCRASISVRTARPFTPEQGTRVFCARRNRTTIRPLLKALAHSRTSTFREIGAQTPARMGQNARQVVLIPQANWHNASIPLLFAR